MPVDTRLTYDDYCLLPDDGKRYEIIDGELFVTPSPRTAHQKIVTRLTRFLSAFAEDANLGEVFVAPFDVVFSNFDVVEPDLLYISNERASVVTEKNVQGSPNLRSEEHTSELQSLAYLVCRLLLEKKKKKKKYYRILQIV